MRALPMRLTSVITTSSVGGASKTSVSAQIGKSVRQKAPSLSTKRRQFRRSSSSSVEPFQFRRETPETAYGNTGLMASGCGVFFNGNDGQAGFELWTRNGSAADTGMLRDQQGTGNGLVDVSSGGMATWGNDLVAV
jgi:ELWxxDGT repeat protein